MAALTKQRMMRIKRASSMDLPVAASKKIYKGAFLVFVGGYIAPASVAANLKPIGRAAEDVDNSSGAAGAATVCVEFLREKTFFPFIASSAFAQTDMGGNAYLDDDQSVTPTATGRSAAGTPYKYETNGSVQTVWVEV